MSHSHTFTRKSNDMHDNVLPLAKQYKISVVLGYTKELRLFIQNSSQSSILKFLKNSFKLLLFLKRCSQMLYLKYDNVYLLWPPLVETLFDLLCLPIAIPCALTLIILFAWRIKTCLYATLSVLSIQISLSLILASSKGHSAWNKRLFALVVSLWPSPPPYITKTNRICFYGSTRLSKICSKRSLPYSLFEKNTSI